MSEHRLEYFGNEPVHADEATGAELEQVEEMEKTQGTKIVLNVGMQQLSVNFLSSLS